MAGSSPAMTGGGTAPGTSPGTTAVFAVLPQAMKRVALIAKMVT